MRDYLLSAVPKINQVPKVTHTESRSVNISEELHELESAFGIRSSNSEQIVERLKRLQVRINSMSQIIVNLEGMLNLKPSSDHVDLEERLKRIVNVLKTVAEVSRQNLTY